MRFSVIAILILCPVLLSAQKDTTFITYDKNPIDDTLIYTTDTLLNDDAFGRAILYGTTVLPMSRNNISAIGHGFTLTKVEGTPCKQSREPVRLSDSKIISIEKNDSLWVIQTSIVENCCYDFLCELAIDSDSILNLVYTGYGDHCGCNCCFGITYTIKIDDYGDVDKVKYLLLNGDKKSLTRIQDL